jgi:hypothetical protein
MRYLALLSLLFVGGFSKGTDLPDVPKPKIDAVRVEPMRPDHRFYDRTAKIEVVAVGSLMAFDMGQTCHNLLTGGKEFNLPTQNCAGAIGFQVLFAAAGEGLSYALHRMGHHRLERLPRLYLMYGNLAGIVVSKRNGAF